MGKKKTEDDNHRMGKYCGYTLLPDGRIGVAPTYKNRFDMCNSERRGINDLMKLFTSHCADLLAEIARRERVIWDEMADDYGVDIKNNEVRYDGEYLTVAPKKEPDSKEDRS